ncbi:unnamed protein product [Cylicocyclus nassatus]|uniref:Uncharacterized protein n=1 Tax=Cylicocyclus nassatus TaxID=53992 RepID=A0AA36HGU3_CYLNA|nr:unnamed protein product [Cylicocyclus nassatus]
METVKILVKDTAATVIQTKDLGEYIKDHYEKSMEDFAKQTTEMPVMQPVEHEKFVNATETPVRVLIDKYGVFVESLMISLICKEEYTAVKVTGKPTTEVPLTAATDHQESDYEVRHGLGFSQPHRESTFPFL